MMGSGGAAFEEDIDDDDHNCLSTSSSPIKASSTALEGLISRHPLPTFKITDDVVLFINYLILNLD